MKKTLLYILFISSSLFAVEDQKDPYAIELEEVTVGGAVRQYQIKCKNYALECPVMLVQEYLGKKLESSPAYIREDGIIAKRQQGYPTIYISDENIVKGESVTLNVIPCDRTRSTLKAPVYAAYKFIPFPIEARGSNGVVLACEMADREMKSYFVKISGLEDAEEVIFRVDSEEGKMEFTETSGESGEVIFVVNVSEGGNEVTASNKRIGTLSVKIAP